MTLERLFGIQTSFDGFADAGGIFLAHSFFDSWGRVVRGETAGGVNLLQRVTGVPPRDYLVGGFWVVTVSSGGPLIELMRVSGRFDRDYFAEAANSG